MSDAAPGTRADRIGAMLRDADQLIAAAADLAIEPDAPPALADGLTSLRFLRERLGEDAQVLAEVLEMIDRRLAAIAAQLQAPGGPTDRAEPQLRRERLELEAERQAVAARFGPRVRRALERFYAALCAQIAGLPNPLLSRMAGDAARLDPELAAALDPLTLDLVEAERRSVFASAADDSPIRRRMAALVIGQRLLVELGGEHAAASAALVDACAALALNDGDAAIEAAGAQARRALDDVNQRIETALAALRAVGGAA